MTNQATQDGKDKLWDIVTKFVKDQRISCNETIYQTDRVIENAYVLIDKLCEVVGYDPVDDED